MKDSLFKTIMELVLSFDMTAVKEKIPQEIIETLRKKHPEISSGKLTEVVSDFLELLQKNSDDQQAASTIDAIREEEIQRFVANTIQKQFQLSETISKNIAFYLLNKDDPNPEIRQKLLGCSIFPKDLELVERSLMGIDVTYEYQSPSKWEYVTKVFIKSADDKIIRYESTGKLSPNGLPLIIKKSFKDEGEKKQRLVLYSLKENKNA